MTALNNNLASSPINPRVDHYALSAPADHTLPGAGIKTGQVVVVYNKSTNNSALTVKSSSASTIDTIRNGRIELVALQDNPTTPSHWLVASIQDSGTYTPAPFSPTNCTTGTVQLFQYMRVDKIVHVTGIIAVSATASVACEFFISLPVTSNLTGTYQCPGVCSHAQVGALYAAGGVLTDATNDRAQIVWRSNTDTVSREMYINFTYIVQ